MISQANSGINTTNPALSTVNVAGVLNTSTPNPTDFMFHNWNDNNGNGVVDAADDLQIQYRRRTGELGTRSEDYNNEMFQAVVGLRGAITDSWDYDVSFQYGETNRVLLRGGYTNLTNFEAALQTTDGVTCENGDATCVPINVFGGYGTITPAMAAYSGATALQQQDYDQLIGQAFVTGSFENLQLPSASSPLAFSFGIEHRDESASLTPDECLKLAPTSCLGGAGGYLLPISGGFTVNELFMEALVPLVDGKTGVQGLDLEVGYRSSDYTPSGSDDTWKFGVNYRPIETLMFRVMQQRAARAPNVDELVSPVVIALDNATQDPCSISNAGSITPALQQLCINDGHVGRAGRHRRGHRGGPDQCLRRHGLGEPADDRASGHDDGRLRLDARHRRVAEPDVLARLLQHRYRQSDRRFCGSGGPRRVLPARARRNECAKVQRVGGTLTLDGSGVELLTRNKVYMQAEGIELGFAFGFDVGMGDLTFSGTANKYLTHEFQSLAVLPVVDCNGYFGTSCENARPEFRMVQRTTWNLTNLSLSMQLRHVGAVAMELPERTTHNPNAANAYEPFYNIDAETYVDLYASYTFADKYLVSFGAMNVTDIDPPVVGNEAASTSFNSGNTFPSNYDVLGPVYTLQLSMQF